MPKITRISFLYALGLSLPIAFGGCSSEENTRTEVTEVKEVPKSEVPTPPKLSTKERLGLTQPTAASANAPAAMPSDSGATSGAYEWELPEGWEDRGATQMRLANVGLAGQPEVECSFTVLGGDGGGLAQNLNRWRNQLGQEPYTPEELEALPKKTLLGQDAVYTVIDGTYSGMGGQGAKDNWRLLGLTLIHEGTAYFVKMTGPAAVLAEQEDKFLAFSASIHSGEGDGAKASALPDSAASGTALPEGHPPVADAVVLPTGHPPIAPTSAPAAGADEGASAGGYHWHAPEGWVKGPDKQMREVTFTVDGAECYVSLLGGMAGGVDANINRWYGQMGLPPLTPEAIKALPTITVLGVQAPLVEIKGAYAGMSGNAIPGQMLLGIVCTQEKESLFVKMTGPEETVSAQASNFVAFCESIHK